MQPDERKLLIERYGGWGLVVLFCLIVVIRWFMVAPIGERFSSPQMIFNSLGLLTGLVGFVLYAINLVLSLRKEWLENLFGGLNRVYIAHHITGGIALALLLFHPLFLALVYIQFEAMESIKDAAKFLLPRWLDFNAPLAQFQEDTAFNNGIVAFIGMVVLLILTFYAKLPYRIWLFTHKFLGVAFLFAGLHVIFIASDVSRDPFLKYYMLIWILIGFGAFVYRSLMSNIVVKRAGYEVERIWVQPKNVVAVNMKPLEDPISFTPGQFVFVRFLWNSKNGINKESHPFSIASSPKENNMQLYMKALGDYTGNLKNIKPGTIAEVEGAYGKFSYTKFPNKAQIWIAGGIGITPFISMARSFDASSPPVTLIYSAATREELVEESIFMDYVPKRHPERFRFFPFISSEQGGAFLNADIVEQISGGLAGKEIFICGPPVMMKSLRKQLRQKGVKNSNIHTEEFSMS